MQSDRASWISGFVAAEGTFTLTDGGTKFVFAVALGAKDRDTCEMLRDFFGTGSVFFSARRKPHHDDAIVFQVRAMADLINVIVPFMDEHLPPSYKRNQYLEWKKKLLDYWEHQARRVRPCTYPGCESSRRAHGLCRHHLYAAGLG